MQVVGIKPHMQLPAGTSHTLWSLLAAVAVLLQVRCWCFDTIQLTNVLKLLTLPCLSVKGCWSYMQGRNIRVEVEANPWSAQFQGDPLVCCRWMGLVLSSWSVLINSNGVPNIWVIKFALANVPLLWGDFVGRQTRTLILLFVHCLHVSEGCGEWYLFRFMSLLAAVAVCVFRWIPKRKALGVRARRVFITPPQLILLKVGLGLSSSLMYFPLIPLLLNLLVLSFIFLPTVTYYWACSDVCCFYSCRARLTDAKKLFLWLISV